MKNKALEARLIRRGGAVVVVVGVERGRRV